MEPTRNLIDVSMVNVGGECGAGVP